jgi:hypothetical protein
VIDRNRRPIPHHIHQKTSKTLTDCVSFVFEPFVTAKRPFFMWGAGGLPGNQVDEACCIVSGVY